jgi:hypothetical protein
MKSGLAEDQRSCRADPGTDHIRHGFLCERANGWSERKNEHQSEPHFF